MNRPFEAAIFDLDGVIVDTAKHHYAAWRELARQLGFSFTLEDNERLKGVSRMASLDILLEVGGLCSQFSSQEKQALAQLKNKIYVALINELDDSALLDGARDTLLACRQAGLKTALGTASRNAGLIVDRTGIRAWFDVIVDGLMVSRAKPDPEVFLLCASLMMVPGPSCLVIEDSQAGLLAARSAGMYSVGIGERHNLPAADICFKRMADKGLRDWLASGYSPDQES